MKEDKPKDQPKEQKKFSKKEVEEIKNKKNFDPCAIIKK